MKTLFCLLMLASFAIAQPVWGPYEIVDTDSAIRDVEICARGDTSDVVWIENNLVLWQRFDLDERIPIGQSDTSLALQAWPKLELHDLTARNDSSWCCIIYQDEYQGDPDASNLTDFLAGGLGTPHCTRLDSGRWIYNIGQGPRSGFSIATDEHGLTAAVWVAESWDPRWDILISKCASIDPADNLHMTGCADMYLIGSQALSRALVWNHAENYVRMIYRHPIMGWGSCFWIDGQDGNCDDVGEYYQGIIALIDLGKTSDSTALLLYSPATQNADPQIATVSYVDSVHFDVDSLRPLGLEVCQTSFFHPSYGFAALQVNPGFLFLARIDTTGAEVQPVGILYETGGESYIVDADVTITDSGQVVAVWSEYTDWGEGPRELKIAWTEWDRFLDTPEQGEPSVPRELALSAYPNPFNSTVTISFDLPRSAPVSLAIFDIQGRLVETLRDEVTQAGQHTIAWAPKELSSGVYFARLDAGDASSTAKLLYLK